MLPLTAIFESCDVAEDRPRRREPSGFEPVLAQAQAAAPKPTETPAAGGPETAAVDLCDEASAKSQALATAEAPDAEQVEEVTVEVSVEAVPAEVLVDATTAELPVVESPPATQPEAAEEPALPQEVELPAPETAAQAPAEALAEESVEESDAEVVATPKTPVAQLEGGTADPVRAVLQARVRMGEDAHATGDNGPKTSKGEVVSAPPPTADVRAFKADVQRAVQAAAADPLGPRVIEQVQRALKTLTLRKGATEVEARISLSPPSLGALRLTVRVSDGELSGGVVAESAAARHVLQTHLPELREALQQQGLTLGQFNIAQDGGHDSDRGRFVPRGARVINSEPDEAAAPFEVAQGRPHVASVVAGRIVGFM